MCRGEGGGVARAMTLVVECLRSFPHQYSRRGKKERGYQRGGQQTVTVLLSEVRMLFKSWRPRMMELPRVAMREALLFTTLAASGAWNAWKVGAITVVETLGSCRKSTSPAAMAVFSCPPENTYLQNGVGGG